MKLKDMKTFKINKAKRQIYSAKALFLKIITIS